MKSNSMRQVFLEKLTVNINVGNDKVGMERAKKLLEKLTGKTPKYNTAHRRLATWGLRPGLPIGYKVTLRGQEAMDFLGWVLRSKKNVLSAGSMDQYGNFSLGVAEYLELPNIKYDSEIGVMGFELMATFARRGYRIADRDLLNKRVPKRQRPAKEEVIELLNNKLGVSVK